MHSVGLALLFNDASVSLRPLYLWQSAVPEQFGIFLEVLQFGDGFLVGDKL